MIAGLLLAAGRGARFGSGGAGKLVAPLGDEAVVRHAARALLAAPVDEVLVVTGVCAAEVAAALRGLHVELVHNERAADGIGTSVARGVAALAPAAEAVVIALGDQPFVPAEVFDVLVSTWRAGGAPIVAPSYGGARGNPVLFDRRLFPELLALSGDAGARSIIERDVSRVTLVDVACAMPDDVDTLADLERLRRHAVPASRHP